MRRAIKASSILKLTVGRQFSTPSHPPTNAFFPVKNFLYAFGDDHEPLPETVRILDELVTDFVIETCHGAAQSAQYSNRQKIKVDDFKHAIRGGELMLGRVQELAAIEKKLKEARRPVDLGDDLKAAQETLGADGEDGAKKGRRGRKPKAAVVVDEDGD